LVSRLQAVRRSGWSVLKFWRRPCRLKPGLRTIIGPAPSRSRTSLGVIATHLKQVHESFVSAGDWFELADAGELAFVRLVVVELGPPNVLYGAESAKRITAEPHFAITAPQPMRSINSTSAIFGMSCASGEVGWDTLMLEDAHRKLHRPGNQLRSNVTELFRLNQ
jgi:hypothetical protein